MLSTGFSPVSQTPGLVIPQSSSSQWGAQPGLFQSSPTLSAKPQSSWLGGASPNTSMTIPSMPSSGVGSSFNLGGSLTLPQVSPTPTIPRTPPPSLKLSPTSPGGKTVTWASSQLPTTVSAPWTQQVGVSTKPQSPRSTSVSAPWAQPTPSPSSVSWMQPATTVPTSTPWAQPTPVSVKTPSPRASPTSVPWTQPSVKSQSPRASPVSPNIKVAPSTPIPVVVPSVQVQTPVSQVVQQKPLTPKQMIDIANAQPFTPTITSGSIPVQIGGVVREVSLQDFDREVDEQRKILLPYYKSLKDGKCENIQNLDIARVQLAKFVGLYKKYKPLNAKVKNMADAEFIYGSLEHYIRSINRLLDVMHICYQRFLKEFADWTTRMNQTKKEEMNTVEYQKSLIQTQEVRKLLDQIGENSKRIADARREMEADLATIQAFKLRSAVPVVTTPTTHQYRTPVQTLASPYFRQLTAIVGATDAELIYRVTERKLALRKKIEGYIDNMDKSSVHSMVNALKIKDFSDKLREIGHIKEADSVLQYTPSYQNVENTKKLYLDLAERKMLKEQLLKLGYQDVNISEMTNLQLRDLLRNATTRQTVASSPRVKQEDQKIINDKKMALVQKYGLLNKDEKTLYDIASATAGKQMADLAWQNANRKGMLIETILNKELGLF